MVELTALVAFYNLVCRLIHGLKVEEDEGVVLGELPFVDPLA